MRSLAALVATTVPALANDYECKDEIKATGYGLFFKEWGNWMAKWSWSNTATVDYGFFYGVEATANEGTGVSPERCAPGWLGLMICEVKGRPCVKKTELECKPNDGQDCPKIRKIQSMLADKRYSVGPIDGKKGPLFEQAIKKFKKDNKLREDSSLDDVVEALNKSLPTVTASQSLF